MKKLSLAVILVLLTLHATAQNNPVPFEENGKYGFKDPGGTIIVPPVYDIVSGFTEGLAAVKKGKKWGYVDLAGNEVIPFVYNNAYPFSEGLARVKKGSRFGFVDSTGKLVIKAIYSAASDFQNGVAFVMKNETEFISFGIFSGETFGFMGPSVNFQLGGSVRHSSDPGWLISDVTTYKVRGLIDKTGKLIIPLKYRTIEKLTENLFKVQHPGYSRFGIFDTNKGKLIIPVKFGDIQLLPDGTFEAKSGKNKITLFKEDGTVIK